MIHLTLSPALSRWRGGVRGVRAVTLAGMAAALAVLTTGGCDDPQPGPGAGTSQPERSTADASADAPASREPATAAGDVDEADRRLRELQQAYVNRSQSGEELGPLIVRLHEHAAAYPTHAASRVLLAQALLSANRAEPAHAAMERAIELEPDRGTWRQLAGTVAVKAGQADRAETHFRRAIELRPGDPLPRLLLATLLVDTDRADQARALCRDALSLDSSLHRAHHLLAAIALERQRFVEARTHARRARELVSDAERNAARSRRVYAVMHARVLQAENRPADALAVLRSIEDPAQQGHPEVLELAASCHVANGRPDLAAREYERLLIERPADLDLAEQAARWHLEAGQLDAARDLLRYARRVDPAAAETRRIARLVAEAERGVDASP